MSAGEADQAMSEAARFESARQVADAVLFEGYLLYPYRASAEKNRLRWQFGVLTPPESGSTEPSSSRTECLVDPRQDPPTLDIAVRFLHVEERIERTDGDDARPWQEAVVQEVHVTAPLHAGVERETPFGFPASEREEDGALRRRYPLHGLVRTYTERVDGPYGTLRARIEILNTSSWQGAGDANREEMLRHSLVSTHTLLGLHGGCFLSLLDPPEWAKPAAESCENVHTYPVLVGEGRTDTMLSSPIILYDYPAIAPESPSDLYDATEIDEILTLRTMALTDEEKQEARDTDPRAAAIIDHVDTMPQEMLDRLHGSVRYLRDVTGEGAGVQPAAGPLHAAEGFPIPPHETGPYVPWWDPGADASVSPETDGLALPSGIARKGSRVALHPAGTGTDAQDMFLVGRTARVEAVFFDVDDSVYLAVTLEDDPGADLHQQHGRYLYFTPDEVELLGDGGAGGTP